MKSHYIMEKIKQGDAISLIELSVSLEDISIRFIDLDLCTPILLVVIRTIRAMTI